MRTFLTKRSSLTELEQLTRQLGRPVRSKDLWTRTVLYQSILHHFGSLPKARQLAGLRDPELQRRWSKDLVVRELRRAHRSGIPITIWDLVAHGRRDLVNAARNYCGGLPRARNLARIPIPPRKKTEREAWDAERVLEEIRERRKRGESLAFSKVPSKLRSAARYHLGAWSDAIEASDLDYDSIRLVRTPYASEDLISGLRALRQEKPNMALGELHRHRLAEACIREFGSLEAAARAAGLKGWPLRLLGPPLTKTQTREALRARRRKKLPITVTDLERDDPHLLHSAIRHFGGLNEAGTAARVTIEPKKKARWSHEELRDALRERWRAGLPMNPAAIRNDNYGVYLAIKKRYGPLSHPYVAKQFGLPPGTLDSVKTAWSRARVIRELKALGRRDRPIVWNEVRPILKLKCHQYFGSMHAARAAAGLPQPRRRWTRAKVIKELRERYRGRATANSYPHTIVSAAQKHFGSWSAATQAAGLSER